MFLNHHHREFLNLALKFSLCTVFHNELVANFRNEIAVLHLNKLFAVCLYNGLLITDVALADLGKLLIAILVKAVSVEEHMLQELTITLLTNALRDPDQVFRESFVAVDLLPHIIWILCLNSISGKHDLQVQGVVKDLTRSTL